MISPHTSSLINEKYHILPHIISKLEPSEVGHIFKNAQNPHAFFPNLGIFSAEFSLGYCYNMHYSKRSNEKDFSSSTPKRRTTRKK